jgi:hypothetical protein
MDNLGDLLQAKKPQEPPQLQALKQYVMTHHNQESKAAQSTLGYSLTVPNASLASTLHMEVPKIIQECNLDKKLFIRIGHF